MPTHSMVAPSPVVRLLVTVRVKTQCERLECLFILVSPMRRRSCGVSCVNMARLQGPRGNRSLRLSPNLTRLAPSCLQSQPGK